MKRRAVLVATTASVLPLSGRAQDEKKIARIGFLPAAKDSPTFKSLRDGLKDIGFIEGDNLVLENRDGGMRFEHLPELAAELLALPADIIVTQGPYGLEAAKKATKTVAIVFAGVGTNFPGLTDAGNLTGVAEEIVESTVKRLTLLKESVPDLHRIGILANSGNYGTAAYMQSCEDWARGKGVMLQRYDVRDPNDFLPAFDRMVADKMEGVLAFTDSIIFRQRELILKTALKYKLPGAYPYREWVEAGGLLSYGPNLNLTLRQQIPPIIDKILKGARPSDIAVERPQSFIFVNLTSAKAMGITLPKSVLDRASEKFS
jgi:putative tryptophan/tyrosine transport system substrate-binding protein